MLLLATAACHRGGGNPAPPRIVAPIVFPRQASTIVVPVSASLAELEAGLNAAAPRVLWRIDERKPRCLAGRRVDLGIGKVALIPDIACRIVGAVARGRIAVAGRGERLTITMPVRATIAVRDVAGVLKKTATGAAIVRADAHLGIAGNWQPTARVTIAYDWIDPPGIDVLGRRITFVGKADARLLGVIAELQRQLPRELARLRLRRQLERVWRQGFTTVALNGRPPAWMRVTPQRLGVGGYRVVGRTLHLTLAADAITETFVGDRPADAAPTPLPPPARSIGRPGLHFFIPVLADYRQLEPVIERALDRLARRDIVLRGIGPVEASFGKVTVYATTGNRLAIGVRASVRRRGSTLLATRGQVWLSALPYNAPGSQRVIARDVGFATQTDSRVVDLLVPLFNDTTVRDSIRRSLAHDFGTDYAKLLDKARRAIGERRQGDFLLSADVTGVRNGTVRATGAGLFLPVEATGEARVAYRPR